MSEESGILGSARVRRAGERVLAIATSIVILAASQKDCLGATPKPAREPRALPG